MAKSHPQQSVPRWGHHETEHLSFVQLVEPHFSHPNPVSPFYWGFSLASFSRDVLLQGSCCPVTWGQDLPQVLMTRSSSSTGLPLGTAPSPSPSLDHRGSSPAGGMRSIQQDGCDPGRWVSAWRHPVTQELAPPRLIQRRDLEVNLG